MAVRTTRSAVTFRAPFMLDALGETLPGGTYEVETEEDIVEGNERTVYVRVATLLYVWTPGMTRTLTVDPDELAAALAKDAAA